MLYKSPFKHLVKNNFLDKKILNYLKNNNLKKISVRGDIILKNPNSSKKRFLTRVVNHNKLNSDFDNEIKDLYKNLFNFLRTKFNKKFFQDLGIDPKMMNKGYYSIIHAWDKPGFHMKPHVDTERKIWTGIIYLFSNGKKNDGCTSLTNKNYTKDIIPEYNKLLAFKRDDLAVHFVKKNKIEREIMLINFNKKINEKKS